MSSSSSSSSSFSSTSSSSSSSFVEGCVEDEWKVGLLGMENRKRRRRLEKVRVEGREGRGIEERRGEKV